MRTSAWFFISGLFVILVIGAILGLHSVKRTNRQPTSHVANDKVQLTDSGPNIAMKNNSVSFTIEKSTAKIIDARIHGSDNLLSPGGYGYFYLNYGIGSNNLTWSPGKGDLTYRVISSDADRVEVSFSIHKPNVVPFDMDFRFVLLAGESGIYHYEIYKYTDDMPDQANIGQARYALRVSPSFTHYAVDDQRQGVLPSAVDIKSGQPVSDATFKLPNGDVYTKYQAIQYQGDGNVYGLYTDRYGISVLKPNNEYFVGGPTKQELTLHQTDTTPILLWHPHTGHYGTPAITPPKGWSKIYGPMMFYMAEGSSPGEMWADAKAKAKTEESRWPYSWLKDPLYAVDSRGTVTGKLTLSDGTSTKDAWVILGAASPDWQLQNLDYLYYTKAGADGTFQIPAVRPGTYTLYTVVKGEFGEYRKDGVEVASNRTASLGPLTWQLPEHRKQLWQIGVPNRSADEFRNGQSHQWGLWFNYPVDFPTDVHFIVGKSDYKTDWNYFQPAIHTPGDPKQLKVPVSTKPAVWTVQFPVNESYKGTAYLTIGIAGSVNGSLKADLNGQEIAKYASIPGGPKVDSSFYRVAAAGIYRTLSIPFDASLLKHGDNLLSLSQLSNSNNAGLLYDALRMEVAP